MKRITTTLAVAAAALLMSSPAMAFHSGGVAECEGCHTMHNSLDGAALISKGTLTQYQAGPYLLKASDQSSACLNCHEQSPGSYHISTLGATVVTNPANIDTQITQYTPGGDFSWLKTSFSYVDRSGATVTVEGQHNGHNVIASDFGYVAAAGTAPGGTYLASDLACSSCHDPHGRYRTTNGSSFSTTGAAIYTSGSYGAVPKTAGSQTLAVGAYRILGGNGYKPASVAYTFTQAAQPIAIAPSTYNVSDSLATNVLKGATIVKYGKDMSEWCANCHARMHESAYVTGNAAKTVHPAGNGATMDKGVPALIYDNYNKYVTSGVAAGTSNYSNLVPFETQLATNATLSAGWTGSASASTTVMCLSCHRAHASGFESMLRFSISPEFQTILDADGTTVRYYDRDNSLDNVKAEGKKSADMQAAMYQRPATVFGAYQRVLCNKCHAKD
jgi:hypothetical protein